MLEEIEPDESHRLAPRLSVNAVTAYNWVKRSTPAKARPNASPGSVEEFEGAERSVAERTVSLLG